MGDEIRFEARFEFDLDDGTKSAAAMLFPDHWRMLPGVDERGWTQREPVMRVLCLQGDALRGQASLVEIRADLPRVLGIADVAVDAGLRGSGLGTRLLRETVSVAERTGCDLILAASRNMIVRRVLRTLNFEIPTPFSVYFRTGDHWHWNETWLARGTTNLPIAIDGDF